jgi:hypothetical protein
MDEFDAFVAGVTEQLRSQLRGNDGESAWQAAQARFSAPAFAMRLAPAVAAQRRSVAQRAARACAQC